MDKVLIIGSSNLDIVTKVEQLPKLGETIKAINYYECCGGKGANQALASQKLGLDVSFLTMLGNDSAALKIKDNLISNKVNLHNLSSEVPTGQAFICVDNNGDNTIIVYPGANNMLKKEHIDLNVDLIKNADALIMQNEILIETTYYALKLAHEFNKITIFNPAPAQKLDDEIFKYIDYLILNETELLKVFDLDVEDIEYINKLEIIKKEKNIKNIILTLGKNGSVLLYNKGYIKFDAYKVKTIDSTAAGDTFIAAFTKKILEGLNAKDAINYASLVSAIVVTRKGAQESIPSLEEIEEFKKNIEG